MSNNSRGRGKANRGSTRGGRGGDRGGRGSSRGSNRGYSNPTTPPHNTTQKPTPLTSLPQTPPTKDVAPTSTPVQQPQPQQPTPQQQPQPAQVQPAQQAPAQPALAAPVAQRPTPSLKDKDLIIRTSSAPPTLESADDTKKKVASFIPSTSAKPYAPKFPQGYPTRSMGFTHTTPYMPPYQGYFPQGIPTHTAVPPHTISAVIPSTTQMPPLTTVTSPPSAAVPKKRPSAAIAIVHPVTGDVVNKEHVSAVPDTAATKEKPTPATTDNAAAVTTSTASTTTPVAPVQDKQDDTKVQPIKQQEPEKPVTPPVQTLEPKPAQTETTKPTPVVKEPETVVEPKKTETLQPSPSTDSLPETNDDVKQNGKGEHSNDVEDQDGSEVDDNPSDSDKNDEDKQEGTDSASSKRVYSKDFLLKFKPMCTTAPDSLKNSEIFTASVAQLNINTQTYRSNTRGSSRDKQDRGGDRRRGGRGGRGRQKTRQPPAKRVAPSWAVKVDSDETAATYAKVIDILNKLTPEKYTKLMETFVKDIKVPDADVLQGVIYRIFDKAVREPNFSSIYADLCHDLSEKLKFNDMEGSNASVFKKLLLNKCQEEFEEFNKEPQDEDKDAEEDTDKPAEEDPEEKRIRERKRMVGVIIFIGELFKKKMLSEKIMHEVIKKLLVEKEVPVEEDLEVLCKLLTTIGQGLDHVKAKQYMDFYFTKIKTLSSNKTLPSRIRFMLIDTVELRANNWVPRIKQEKAKTIKEVHADAIQDKINQEKAIAATSYKKIGGGDRTKSSKKYGDDRRRDKYDSKVPTPSKQHMKHGSHNIKKLGPEQNQQGAHGSVGWGGKKQDTTTTTTTPKDEQPAPTPVSNQFDALRDEDSQDADNEDAETPVTPADDAENATKQQPEEPLKELSEPELEKAVSGIIGNLTETMDIGEALTDMKRLFIPDTKLIIVHLVKKSAQIMTQTQFIDIVVQLIEQWSKDSAFADQLYLSAIESLLSAIAELELPVESPQQFKNIGEIIGRFVAMKLVSLDQINQVLTKNASVLSSSAWADFVSSILVGYKKQLSQDTPSKSICHDICKSKFHVMRFINPSKSSDIDKYIKNMKSAGMDQIDPVSFVLGSIKDNKSEDQVVTWIEDNLPEDTGSAEKVISAVISGVEVNSTFVVRKSSDDLVLFDKYWKVLNMFVADTPSNHGLVISELVHFCAKSNFEKDVLARVIKYFKSKFLKREAIEKWISSNVEISGKDKAIDVLRASS